MNGDILSQALFAGLGPKRRTLGTSTDSRTAQPCRFTRSDGYRKAFYCHQLCPHGAAQQWMRNFRKKPIRLPKGLDGILKYVRLDCLSWSYFLPSPLSAHTVAILEPFDAYVWEVAGGITIAIALISLVASAFVPMAYCRYGCPTGTVLKLFEFKKGDEGWNTRDYLSFSLLVLALVLLFILKKHAPVPFGFSLCLFASCVDEVEDTQRLLSLKGQALGTTWSVKLISSKPIDEDELQTELAARIEETEKNLFPLATGFQTLPNKRNPFRQTLFGPPHASRIAQAREVDASANQRRLRSTIAPLVNLWGFGPVFRKPVENTQGGGGGHLRKGASRLEPIGNLERQQNPQETTRPSNRSIGFGKR